jgi:hypothetical protein
VAHEYNSFSQDIGGESQHLTNIRGSGRMKGGCYHITIEFLLDSEWMLAALYGNTRHGVESVKTPFASCYNSKFSSLWLFACSILKVFSYLQPKELIMVLLH